MISGAKSSLECSTWDIHFIGDAFVIRLFTAIYENFNFYFLHIYQTIQPDCCFINVLVLSMDEPFTLHTIYTVILMY